MKNTIIDAPPRSRKIIKIVVTWEAVFAVIGCICVIIAGLLILLEWIKCNSLNTAFFEFIKYGKYDKQNIAFAAFTVFITAGMSLYGAMTFLALYYGKQNTGQAQSSTLTLLSESKMEAGDAMHALSENTKYIATKNDQVARNRTQKMLQQRADSAKAEVARWQRKADE